MCIMYTYIYKINIFWKRKKTIVKKEKDYLSKSELDPQNIVFVVLFFIHLILA
jgi:hypothetical protein